MDGDLKGGGHILQATSGSGANRQTFNYSTDRVVGNGSFGVVFQATCLETGETVRPKHRVGGRAGGIVEGRQAEKVTRGFPRTSGLLERLMRVRAHAHMPAAPCAAHHHRHYHRHPL